MNPEHETPKPACILSMREMIAKTAQETADRVEHMLDPVFKRLTAVEYRIHGNGTPGLAEQIRELQRQHMDMQRAHEDSIRLRNSVIAGVAVHVISVLGAIWWAATWVAKVNHALHLAEMH